MFLKNLLAFNFSIKCFSKSLLLRTNKEYYGISESGLLGEEVYLVVSPVSRFAHK